MKRPVQCALEYYEVGSGSTCKCPRCSPKIVSVREEIDRIQAERRSAAAAPPATTNDIIKSPAHYVGSGGVQPIDFIMSNGLTFPEGNVVKYITRHRHKNGAEDVRKAIAYCTYILTKVYGQKP